MVVIAICFDINLWERTAIYPFAIAGFFFPQSISSTQCTKLSLQVSFLHLNRYHLLT